LEGAKEGLYVNEIIGAANLTSRTAADKLLPRMVDAGRWRELSRRRDRTQGGPITGPRLRCIRADQLGACWECSQSKAARRMSAGCTAKFQSRSANLFRRRARDHFGGELETFADQIDPLPSGVSGQAGPHGLPVLAYRAHPAIWRHQRHGMECRRCTRYIAGRVDCQGEEPAGGAEEH